METLKKRLGNLLAVKSIVTITLTAVFAYLTCTGGVTAEQFLTVFTVVIAFYFGDTGGKSAPSKAAVIASELHAKGAAGEPRELWRFPERQPNPISGVPLHRE